MKKFCVDVLTKKGTLTTQMSIDIEPTDKNDGKATLWCEKCDDLNGTIKITKVTKKYRWTWDARVIGSQNHHVLVSIATPRRKEIM